MFSDRMVYNATRFFVMTGGMLIALSCCEDLYLGEDRFKYSDVLLIPNMIAGIMFGTWWVWRFPR